MECSLSSWLKTLDRIKTVDQHQEMTCVPRIITDYEKFPLDHTQLWLWSCPLVLETEKRTLDHSATVWSFFSSVRFFWCRLWVCISCCPSPCYICGTSLTLAPVLLLRNLPQKSSGLFFTVPSRLRLSPLLLCLFLPRLSFCSTLICLGTDSFFPFVHASAVFPRIV